MLKLIWVYTDHIRNKGAFPPTAHNIILSVSHMLLLKHVAFHECNTEQFSSKTNVFSIKELIC